MRVATAFSESGITAEALDICALLIDSDEEALLEDRGFADALPAFVQSVQRSLLHSVMLGAASAGMGELDVMQKERETTEIAMVEVLFGIASRLRLEPHVLRVWFRPEKPDEDEEDLSDDERRTRKEEFALFYKLLHYVPYEGRAGEFARMGLLYVVEAASKSVDLEKWIVEGDMAALMASGLGALYSQLSR